MARAIQEKRNAHQENRHRQKIRPDERRDGQTFGCEKRTKKTTVEVALRSPQPTKEIGRDQPDAAGANAPRANVRLVHSEGNEEASMIHLSKFTTLFAISLVASVSALGCNAETANSDIDEELASVEESATSSDESAASDESVAASEDADAIDDESTAEDESALSAWGRGGYGYYRGYRGYGHYRGYGRFHGYRGYGHYGRGYYRGYRGYGGYCGGGYGYGGYGCGGYGYGW
jgi:hypothetical protein